MDKKISGKCPAEDRPREIKIKYKEIKDAEGITSFYKTVDFDCLIGDAGKCPVHCKCPIWEKAPKKL
jgi:hypothetical protein